MKDDTPHLGRRWSSTVQVRYASTSPDTQDRARAAGAIPSRHPADYQRWRLGQIAAPPLSIVFFGPETHLLYHSLTVRQCLLLSFTDSCLPCLTAYNQRLRPVMGQSMPETESPPEQVLAKSQEMLAAFLRLFNGDLGNYSSATQSHVAGAKVWLCSTDLNAKFELYEFLLLGAEIHRHREERQPNFSWQCITLVYRARPARRRALRGLPDYRPVTRSAWTTQSGRVERYCARQGLRESFTQGMAN